MNKNPSLLSSDVAGGSCEGVGAGGVECLSSSGDDFSITNRRLPFETFHGTSRCADVSVFESLKRDPNQTLLAF